jgi:formimidoylglutamate deiminase
MASYVLEADLTWTGAAFESEIQVEVDEAGKIARAGRLGLTADRRLAGLALLPGMVNAHSHAFQRGLRGRTERFPQRSGNFWGWRDQMYALARAVDAERFRELSLAAFLEMRAAGITTVGEFHYLHHVQRQDFALDEQLLGAATQAGVRLVLLEVYYRLGGINKPLREEQQRFETKSTHAFWKQLDRLAERIDPARQSLGVAVHSVRAAGREEIGAIHAESLRRGLVFHMHVEEQRQEIADCRGAYGRTPLALLLSQLGSCENVTAVHCTHSEPDELASFAQGGGRVCLCPVTEANLGDGIPGLSPLAAHPASLCLGTDSNSRISFAEEMRWLSYVQRLKQEQRAVLANERGEVASALFAMATTGGARALGVDAGRIAAGAWADFMTLDLGHPSLAGWTAETLIDAFVFGGADGAIQATCVGGRWE